MLWEDRKGERKLVFPGGSRIDEYENPLYTAARETIEETGVQNLEVRHFITKTYHIFQRNGKFKLKITYWYEMYSDYQGPLIPQAAEGIKKAKWKNFEQSQKALQDSYENIKIIFPKEYLITHPNDRIPKV